MFSFFGRWLRRLAQPAVRLGRAKRTPPLRRTILHAEMLEDRTVPSHMPVGGEFLANTQTTSAQFEPAIASDADGDFVIVWTSLGQDGDGYGIYGQRYNSTGVAQGTEFRVNTTTTGDQRHPAIAMDADGDFVVAWESPDADGIGVFARQFDAVGNPQGFEFQVNRFDTGDQKAPTTATNIAGAFVIAWESAGQDGAGFGIFTRRFDYRGIPQATEFQVNTTTAFDQNQPAVAMDATGGFVVVWTSQFQDGSSGGIFGQRFDTDGELQGIEFPVNTTTTSNQRAPAVAMNYAGDFVALWESNNQDGDGSGIYGQRFDETGLRQGTEFPVNTTSTDHQRNPALAIDANGDFVAVWSSLTQDGDGYGIYAREYNAAGAAQTGEVRVNTTTTSEQHLPAIAIDADGDYTAIWQSNDQDGSSYGAYAQRYDEPTDTTAPFVTAVFVDGRRIDSNEWFMQELTEFVVAFSEELSVAGGDAGPGSVTNPANWMLFETGSAIAGAFSEITFGFNVATGRYEAALPAALPRGDYEIVIGGSLVDLAGNAFDPNVDGVTGDEFRLGFHTGAQIRDGGARLIEQAVFNSETGNYFPYLPSIAYAPNGDYVMSWYRFGGYGQAVQRFSRVGIPLGPPIELLGSGETDIAFDAEGNYVVVWERSNQNEITSWQEIIMAQVFNADGTPKTPEFQVNEPTGDNDVFQSEPVVAMSPDGSFVVVWSKTVIEVIEGSSNSTTTQHARVLDANGNPQTAPFQVGGDFQTYYPDVAMDPNGEFIVVWPAESPVAQRYNRRGDPLGARIEISNLSSDFDRPSIGMNAEGEWVVAWNSSSGNYGILAQRFDRSDTPDGAMIVVSSDDERFNPPWNEDRQPAIAVDQDGDFVVAWVTEYGINAVDRDHHLFARQYTRDGEPLAEEFLVNADIGNTYAAPDIGLFDEGDFVIAFWSDDEDFDWTIYAQRFADPRFVDFTAPVVLGVQEDGASLDSGDRVLDPISGITVTFSEDLWGDAAIQSNHRVTDLSNWSMSRNGQSLPSILTQVTFAFDAESSRHQAVLSLSHPLDEGAYQLRIDDAVWDTFGNALDGDGDISPGGDFVFDFEVAVPRPAGPESLVSQGSAGADSSAVANVPGGGSVVVWTEQGTGIVGQLYDEHGAAVGAEFTVISGAVGRPDVAAAGDGSFVVVWQGNDADSSGVFARRFDASGSPVGSEFPVNVTTMGFQSSPHVAMDADGSFVVSWSGDGAFYRPFDATGMPLDTERRVDEGGALGYLGNDIAVDNSGDVVVVWDEISYAEGGVIKASKFDSNGTALTDRMVVNQTPRWSASPAVAVDADGDFVVAWEDYDPGDDARIRFRRYDNTGQAAGDEQTASNESYPTLFFPAVAMNLDGDFVIGWNARDQDGSSFGIFGRRYSRLGNPQGEEFQVNTTTAGAQLGAAVAMNDFGELFFTWTGPAGAQGTDQIFLQRYLSLKPDGAEANDAFITAKNLGTVTGGKLVSGLSIDEVDADFFRFRTTTAGTVGHEVALSFVHEQGDLTLELFDAEQNFLRRSAGLGNREAVSLDGLPAGTYFARVIGAAGAVNPFYELTIAAGQAVQTIAADMFEPNDAAAGATDLGTVAGRFSAELTLAAGDEDWFRYQVPAEAGAGYFARIDFVHAQGDLVLELYNAGGTIRLDSRLDSTNDFEQIDFGAIGPGLPPGEDFLLRVAGVGESANPHYSLTLQTPQTSYVPDYLETIPMTPPNDGFSTATNMGEVAGSSSLPNLSITPGDQDYFRFSMVATGSEAHRVSIDFDGAAGDLVLELYDSTESLLASSIVTATGRAISLLGRPSGDYFVRVGRVADSTNVYSITIDAPTAPVDSKDDWTILVYMTASDLSGRAENDINELERSLAALPGTVNVAVYLDQAQEDPFATGGGAQAAWGDAGRAILISDRNLTSVATTFELLGEQDSGDPATLRGFVNWAVGERPADRYALVLWGHGLGVWGSNFDDHDPEPLPDPVRVLTPVELDEALTGLSQMGIAIDLLAFDASLMAMAEVVQVGARHAPVVVASEMVGETLGFDYDEALTALHLEPSAVSAQVLASQIVASYKERYNARSSLTAFDSAGVDELTDALTAFSLAVQSGATVTDFEHLDDARSGAKTFGGRSAFRDLGSFARTIADNAGVTQAIRDAALGVSNALRATVIAEASNPQTISGLSIYFPDELGSDDSTDYFALFEDFDQASEWFGFLQAFTDSTGSKAGTFDPDRFEIPERNDVSALAHNFFGIAGVLPVDSLTIDRTGDTDWYRFTISAAGSASNRVALAHDLVDGAATSMQLTLFEDTESADQVGPPIDTSAGQGLLSLQGLPAGKYLMRARANGVVPRYSLTIDAPSMAASSDRAGDNGTMGKAFELVGIAELPLFSGFVLPIDAQNPGTRTFDWFKFSGPQLLNPTPTLVRIVSDTAETIRLRLVRSDGSQVLMNSGTGQVEIEATFAPGVTYFLEVSAASTSSIGYAIDFLKSGPVDATPPMVMGVRLHGSGWNTDWWYSIPAGPNQLLPVPWTNIDQIQIVFSESVAVQQGDLVITAVVGSYSVAGFSYDDQNLTATWTLAQPFAPDNVMIALADSVEDASGNALDGEWAGQTDSFPSGNGSAGGAFSFRFHVLPGDVNGTGNVDVFDPFFTRLRIGQQEGQPSYATQYDVNGDGQINVFDVLFVRLRVGQTSPPSEPGLATLTETTSSFVSRVTQSEVDGLSAKHRAAALDLLLVDDSVRSGPRAAAGSERARSGGRLRRTKWWSALSDGDHRLDE